MVFSFAPAPAPAPDTSFRVNREKINSTDSKSKTTSLPNPVPKSSSKSISQGHFYIHSTSTRPLEVQGSLPYGRIAQVVLEQFQIISRSCRSPCQSFFNIDKCNSGELSCSVLVRSRRSRFLSSSATNGVWRKRVVAAEPALRNNGPCDLPRRPDIMGVQRPISQPLSFPVCVE